METTQTSTIASIDSRSAWRKTDTMWMLGLYGTAIAAGDSFPDPDCWHDDHRALRRANDR